MKAIMMLELNKQQERAVEHFEGPCLVVASPGSGKTRVLIERAASLIDKGVNPNNLVNLTFTNKAANEMKERLSNKIGSISSKSYTGTFHALCVLILRKYGHKLGYSKKFSIVDSDDQVDLVKKCSRSLDSPVEKFEAYRVANAVNKWREELWDRQEYEEYLTNHMPLINIGDLYLEKLKKSDSMDFSGLLYETIQLLEQENEVLERIQDKVKFLQVDESQDTNYAQFHLINLFSDKYDNILLAGDVDQSIYAFRGARYKNIQDFMSKHQDNIEIIELPLNYRSTPQIVKSADRLICNNSSHMNKEFVAVNGDGEEIKFMQAFNEVEEGKFVARQIRKLIDEGGWDPGDAVILYRMNSMTEPIERALVGEGIRYKVIGGRSFYSRKEIKDCISMLKFIVNPKDGIAFHRVASLFKGMGDVTIGKIESISEKENINLIDATNKMYETASKSNVKAACKTLYDVFNFNFANMATDKCLNEIVNRIQYYKILENMFENWKDRVENIEELISQASLFVENNGPSINTYLQSIALISPSDDKEEKDNVTLMTLHASKGLEFPIVFLIGMDQDILPHSMSLKEDPFEGLEEERRLCYVGMTRAEKLLYLTHCKNRRRRGFNGFYDKKYKPSRFLYETGLLKKNKKKYH